jgi:two-component system, chemotaxis family, CheB/CheR fusion protein
LKPKRPNTGRKTKRSDSKSAPSKPEDRLLIVAVGASAGGIEAFTELIRELPADTGMAFVFIQHLDPKHHSILTELLARETSMTVKEVTDGMRLEPNRVYVIPPNATMTLSDHVLKLAPRGDLPGTHMPIDHYMRSLAEEQGTHAVGVILSGFGSDGTLGLAEIQAQGGVTFAQAESSAKYDGMPRSAIAAGYVDYVLPPKMIARELTRIAHHPYVGRANPPAAELVSSDSASLSSIFQLLRRSTGLDFTHYRQTTILRRIQRRMVVHKIDRLQEYVKYVQTNPSEIKALYQDMLINVTSFFRNPTVFDAMKNEVFPHIVANRRADAPIRVWTPGCASGEETYSVAIALLEYLGDNAPQTPIQFFGTDVSETSIAKARAGLYPENIQGDVSAERLRRFFNKAEGSYRISKSIRDMCIFAQHNLLNDPPFSQMDLICCRNLLIYLEPILQSKVISLFHYSAKPNGFLVLGSSEGVGAVGNLFSTVERTHKIFMKKGSSSRQVVTFSLNPQTERAEYGPVRLPSKTPDTAWNYLEAQKEFDRRLLAQYSPAAAFINDDLEIVHTRGNINRYLKLSPGRASLSIVKMAREGLLYDLRNAIIRARKENKPIRKQNVQIKIGNGNGNGETPHDHTRLVNFEVVPLKIGNLNEGYFMVLFEDALGEADAKQGAQRAAKRARDPQRDAVRIAKLEEELAATKEYLQSVIETQEATNEELQSANEEILSSNEELQSTNEELETAKEELQSANEELTTVNDELRSRNIEITQVNNDLTNLFASIDLTVVMIGSDLTIRRFTPRAEKVMGLIPADIGRPFLNINPTVEIPDLQQMVLSVISSMRAAEKEVTDRHGNRYQVRILPYRTTEGANDGVVITVVEVAPK